jgi:hypothetical protein
MKMVQFIVDYGIIIYTIVICLCYFLLALISAAALINYKRKNCSIDDFMILSSPLSPSISVIAPAYNESKTIVDNIRALLALHYNVFEVIIVNDGSTDDSLKKIIKEYELEKVNFFVNKTIKTKEIIGIYRSRNKAYTNLTIVDKINGGKADSLNAGINVAKYDYFLAIDVDSVIEPNALIQLVKPILNASDKKVIAVGGVIRIINSCDVVNGNLIRVDLPKNIFARFQILEYTRAFLMGRMAWSKLDGLLLISGALGLFDKQVVIECGGYNHNTVGEDMELVVRIRRYMYEKKIKHEVAYIPDPLCWTEVPTNIKILSRQRNRWTRGTMDTLKFHRKIFFNYRYGAMGMLGYPFWFFFEWLAPIIEFLGIIYFLFMFLIGGINWPFFIFLSIFVYLFSVSFSFYAILYEETTFHRYPKYLHVAKLILTALIEPLFYHQLNVIWAIKGNISFFKGDKKWGTMERKGFKE